MKQKCKYKYIHSLVGQDAWKREISFLLDGFERTSYFPHLIQVAPRGTGKSLGAKAIGAELSKINQEIHGHKKGFIEINCSEIKDADTFLTKLFPLIVENKFCTLFLDEISFAGNSFVAALLTILNPTDSRKTEYFMPDGNKFEFDFHKLTVLAATTAPQDCHPDLLDRFRRAEFEEFENEQLAQIIMSKTKGIDINPDILLEMATTVRGNCRKAVQRAEDIKACGVTTFGAQEWHYLRNSLSIMPLGLSKIEIQYLKLLKRLGNVTLTELSGRIGMTPQSIQQDIEIYLRRQGLFRTNGPKGRALTREGHEIVEKIENSN